MSALKDVDEINLPCIIRIIIIILCTFWGCFFIRLVFMSQIFKKKTKKKKNFLIGSKLGKM